MAYASGMDKFLETRWFSERGLQNLLANSVLCDQFAMLIHRFAMNQQDPAYAVQLQVTQSLEAMVVWSMLGMCRKVALTKNESGGIDPQDVAAGVLEASKRLQEFEALITGDHVSLGSAQQESEVKANGSALEGQLKSREIEFWSLVHTFLTVREDSPTAMKDINANLTSCRNLLENRENRDVLYSIMVARFFGPKLPGFPNQMKQPETNDESDISAKLTVAKRFLEDEAGGRGTNQVVQRLSGVAVRSWALKS